MKFEIPFNIPFSSGDEIESIQLLVNSIAKGGSAEFSIKLKNWLQNYSGNSSKVYLTHSCTAAIEMASVLCDIHPGDEVIMPSFTYVSSANAFVLHGAIPVFVDIRPDTMNINEKLIEEAITQKTKALVVMHYGGVCCGIDEILQIAQRHGLFVIEDAATAFPAAFKGRPCGTFGDFGCLSFDITKNIHGFGGGVLFINNENLIREAEIAYQRGTNRTAFLSGKSKYYEWTGKGGSFSMNELTAAFIFSQLQYINKVQERRNIIWKDYKEGLKDLVDKEKIVLQSVPGVSEHSAHLFYIKLKDKKERQKVIQHMNKLNIETAFHYIPLHNSVGGKIYGRFCGKDVYTTAESERLIRLPLYPGLTDAMVGKVIEGVQSFFL